MILSIVRDVIMRDRTVGMLTCGDFSCFTVERSLLPGREPAVRMGQYVVERSPAGPYFVDDRDVAFRIVGEPDIARAEPHAVCVGLQVNAGGILSDCVAPMSFILDALERDDLQVSIIDPRDVMQYGARRGDILWPVRA